MSAEEAVGLGRREVAASAEDGYKKFANRQVLRNRSTQELREEIRDLRQEQRNLRTALDSRDAKFEAAIDRMRSETRDGLTKLEAAIDRMRSETRDDIKALGTRLEAAVDRLHSEAKDEFKELHREDREIRQEVRGLTRWSIATVVTSVLAAVAATAAVITLLVNHVK